MTTAPGEKQVLSEARSKKGTRFRKGREHLISKNSDYVELVTADSLGYVVSANRVVSKIICGEITTNPIYIVKRFGQVR